MAGFLFKKPYSQSIYMVGSTLFNGEQLKQFHQFLMSLKY